MATLIPDPLPTSATNGEKELARVLRRLPESWTIYYEPRVNGLHPDFVILAPEFGLLVLEVKDWWMSSLQAITAREVEIQSPRMAQAKRVTNPLVQAEGYWRAVKDACAESVFGQPLMVRDGRYRGHLCFPVGAAVVFTRLSRDDVNRSPHRAAWEAVFTPESVVLADQRRTWEEADEAGLVAALRPYFRPFVMPEPFTAHQIDVLRWVLFPESRMDVILGGKSSNPEAALRVLDARQEQHARSLGSGHRILFGVAGSGKTVLLLARARWLAREQPESRTLFLCFNKVLAAWLTARLADCPTVTVRHFDGWARDLGLSRQYSEFKNNQAFGRRLLADLQARGDEAREWDTILVDEAQDFDPTWFECVVASLKDPENGDLVIVADGCQQLYKPRAFTWKSVGVKAAGRSISARYDLDKNYRNTPKIAALAFPYSADGGQGDGIQSRRVTPNTCRRYNVSAPTIVTATDHGAQVAAALEIVGRWIQGRRQGRKAAPLNPQDIGIFYPRLTEADRPHLAALLAGLCALAPTRWLQQPEDPDAHCRVTEDAIKVQTIHSAKGLQYRAVIVLWTDALAKGGDLEESDRRLLYVAITRAEDDLVLLGNDTGLLAHGLEVTCPSRHFESRELRRFAAA